MTEFDSSLEAEVRRAEPDLWLASRLVADPAARADVIALYAVQVELAKVAGAASNPLAGEIRLAWWREEAEAMISTSRALGSPALKALQAAPGLDPGALDRMIEARHAELEPRPFADEAALLGYLDGVDGGLMAAAAGLLSPGAPTSIAHAARAWGWTRLLRERPAWRAKARDWAPVAWGDASDTEIRAHVRHRVADALSTARGEAAASVIVFPALAYAALASPYAKGRSPSALEKRMRLVWASLRGKI